MWETITTGGQSPLQTASAPNRTQDGRLIAVQTPLGKDRLLLTSLVGEEAISRLFAYEIEMMSLDQAISAEMLIERRTNMTIAMEEGKTHPINGLVSHPRAGPLVGRDLRLYSASVVPWLWYLRQATDCRISQNLNLRATEERDFGRVFFYTTAEFAKTGDRQFLKPGNGPLVVDQNTGEPTFLSSSMPPGRAIAALDARWRAERQR
jgi:uncharacterized protein involved in type VI secretion and phage assembly